MSEKFEFKVGDRVSFGGAEGVVRDINDIHTYPVEVVFKEDSDVMEFTRDGRFLDFHTEPLLKFIERPKKTVKKKLYKALCKDSLGLYESPGFYASEKEAQDRTEKAFIRLLTEYPIEIEVEE